MDDLMHATYYPQPFDASGWIFEEKLDGIRVLVRRSGNRLDLLSRRGNSLAEGFPELMRVLPMLPDHTVVDAALVVPDDRQVPSFAHLQRRTRMRLRILIEAASVEHPAALCVFDCLVLRGKDIRDKPLLTRKALIDPHVEFVPGVRRVGFIETIGVTTFAAAVRIGAEGVVAKRGDSIYRAGRQTTWRKIRNARYVRT